MQRPVPSQPTLHRVLPGLVERRHDSKSVQWCLQHELLFHQCARLENESQIGSRC